MVGHRGLLSGLEGTEIQKAAFFEIAFSFKPLGPIVLSVVGRQDREMGKQGADFLAAGTSQAQRRSDCGINGIAQIGGHLVEVRASLGGVQHLEMFVGTGEQDQGKQEMIGQRLFAAAFHPGVEPIDGAEIGLQKLWGQASTSRAVLVDRKELIKIPVLQESSNHSAELPL